jgi:hypothetical protein
MTLSDRLGLAVSTSSSEALMAYEQGLDLALRWRSGAMEALTTAVGSEPLSPSRTIRRRCGLAHGAGRYGSGSTQTGTRPAGQCVDGARTPARADH